MIQGIPVRRVRVGAVLCAGVLLVSCTHQGNQERSVNPVGPSSISGNSGTVAATPSAGEVGLLGSGDGEGYSVTADLSGTVTSAPATPALKGTATYSFTWRYFEAARLYQVNGWIRVVLNRAIGVPRNTLVRGEMAASLIGRSQRVTGAEKTLTFTIPNFTSACPVPSNRADAVRLVDLTRNRLILRIPVTWNVSRC